MPVKVFDEDFLWGASTAGHQVEGGNYDQWTVWELANASELAKTAERRLRWMPDWLKFKKQAQDPDNYVSGKGVDHYHRYTEDFDIVKKLGLNAFRFSIEWARLEPQEGVWDPKEIDHYHNYIAELKKRGIEPIVNLWHWTHPVWFEERGGFARHENLSFWMRYVTKFAEEFGHEVTYVLPLNEPNVYVANGYMHTLTSMEYWPPQGTKLQGLLVYWRLVKAHKLAYRILKRANPKLKISIAQSMANNQPKNPASWLDRLIARAANYVWNWWFINRIKKYLDIIGFNYYFTGYYDGFKMSNPIKPTNDRGWYMEPGGIHEVITKLWVKYHKPIMVTENGVADADDHYRQWWLKETMVALIKSRQAGVNLVGYLHWSLLDNFEWSMGWWPKFGLAVHWQLAAPNFQGWYLGQCFVGP